jgi:UDP-glucuronate 4-epimerase
LETVQAFGYSIGPSSDRGSPVQLVLITGGAGFIGSHVAGHYLAEGVGVRVLDNLDGMYDPAVKRRNLEMLQAQGGPRFEFVAGDLRDAAACRTAVRSVDAVVHLAALAGVRPSIQDPVRYMAVNVDGTQQLLQQIDSRAVPFVFGSSSSVYGGNTKVPFAESDPVDRPVSPYAASKKAGELLCYTWHHLHRNPVTCLRFFTVYGERQRPEMAIHHFARCILGDQPIPFFGDGSSRRDYTYVGDIVAGVAAAVVRAKGHAIYNLGGAATTSLRELVDALGRELGRTPRLQPLPDQPGDVPVTYADVSLAGRALGYRVTTPLAEGLRRFCAWYVAERREGRLP